MYIRGTVPRVHPGVPQVPTRNLLVVVALIYMADARSWYHLTLPGSMSFKAFNLPPPKDPLLLWPNEWFPDDDVVPWHKALSWEDVPAFRGNMKEQVGFEQFTVNYAFNYCFDQIPTREDKEARLLFDVRDNQRGEADFLAKQRYFFSVLQFVHRYPRKREMQDVFGFSSWTFNRFTKPALYNTARHVNFVDWNLRLWDYNHTPHFIERVQTSFDGFPISVCGSSNKWVRRLTKSKKIRTLC